MSSRSLNAASVAAVIAVASVVGYWYWSPYFVILQMQNAAMARDADAFNDRVDYFGLSESLKGQLAEKIANKLGATGDSGTGLTDLGTAIGMAFVDPLVGAMVNPQTVMRAMRDGRLAPNIKQPDGMPSQSSSKQDDQASKEAKADKPKWAYERKDANQLVAYVIDPRKPDEKRSDQLGLVFRRSGFANWKLTEIRIPTLNKLRSYFRW